MGRPPASRTVWVRSSNGSPALIASSPAIFLLAATAANVQPLDTVFVDIKDTEGLRRDCLEGAWMGFTGKITIHPSQIEVVNEIFTPSTEEIAESKELLAAFEENQKAGRMAFSFKGQMVDVPHLTRARTILERARLAGIA